MSSWSELGEYWFQVLRVQGHLGDEDFVIVP